MAETKGKMTIKEYRAYDSLYLDGKCVCSSVSKDISKSILECWNSHDDLLAACEKAQFVYDYVICRTPTGPERNKLTERNILRLQAIAKVKKSK